MPVAKFMAEHADGLVFLDITATKMKTPNFKPNWLKSCAGN